MTLQVGAFEGFSSIMDGLLQSQLTWPVCPPRPSPSSPAPQAWKWKTSHGQSGTTSQTILPAGLYSELAVYVWINKISLNVFQQNFMTGFHQITRG